jgi:hypothetical protein
VVAAAAREALLQEAANAARVGAQLSRLSHGLLCAQARIADTVGTPSDDALAALLRALLAYAQPPAPRETGALKGSNGSGERLPKHVSEAAWALLLAVLRRAQASAVGLLFHAPSAPPPPPASSASSRGASGDGGVPSFEAWGLVGDALGDDFSDLCFGESAPLPRADVRDAWWSLLEDAAAGSALGDAGALATLAGAEAPPTSIHALMELDSPATAGGACDEPPLFSGLAVALRGAVLAMLRQPSASSPAALQSALLVLNWCLLSAPRGATRDAASASGSAATSQCPLSFWAALVDPVDGIYCDHQTPGDPTDRALVSGGIALRGSEGASGSGGRRTSSSSSSGRGAATAATAATGAGAATARDERTGAGQGFVRGGVIGALLACDALPSADHDLLAVQVTLE